MTENHGLADVVLDHDRAARRGYPEAVYCEGKSLDQLRTIAAACRDRGARALSPRRAAAARPDTRPG